MKPDLQIRCAKCYGPADFIFGQKIKVKKKDAKYFSKSKHFILEEEKSFGYGRTKFFTRHYPIISPCLENLSDIPDEYKTGNVKGGFVYLDFSGQCLKGGHGVAMCSKCSTAVKHKLKWPQDAHFQIDYKGKTLWAYDRSYALKLLNYIQSNERKKRLPTTTKYITQDYFLRKIPEHFQTKKARGEIVKKLSKLLGV